MGQLIPFESAQLPAHLRANPQINDDLTSHAGGGFPVLSIKGKSFAIVRDGERNLVMNPKDNEAPANYMELVIVKANSFTSKVWYANGYVEGAEAKKPDCFSNDGKVPEDASEMKQSTSCATCKHNQWGSRITPDGKKGKSCADSVRMAVSGLGSINDPMLLRVPPATIRSLGEYGTMLKKRGVSYTAVLTRVGFDAEQATPKLTFKPLAFLNEAQYAEVMETRESDVVQSILGSVGLLTPEGEASASEAFEQASTPADVTPPANQSVKSKSKTVSDEEIAAALEAEREAAEEAELERQLAAKKAAKKAKADQDAKNKQIAQNAMAAELPVDDAAIPANMDVPALDLSGLSFDD